MFVGNRFTIKDGSNNISAKHPIIIGVKSGSGELYNQIYLGICNMGLLEISMISICSICAFMYAIDIGVIYTLAVTIVLISVHMSIIEGRYNEFKRAINNVNSMSSIYFNNYWNMGYRRLGE